MESGNMDRNGEGGSMRDRAGRAKSELFLTEFPTFRLRLG